MIIAYYDESGEYKDNKLANMTVGVCVSHLEKWNTFDLAWRSSIESAGLPKGTEFKTADFSAWVSPFDFKVANGHHDKERHNGLLNSLLTAMLDNVEWFQGFSISAPISNNPSDAHKYALEDCICGAITHAVHDLWEHYQEPIKLVFDKQKHFGLNHIQKIADIYDFGSGKGRIRGVSFDNSCDISPLQAADLLAYEMSKIQRDGHPERYPFKVIREGCAERNLPCRLKWGPFGGPLGRHS